jgi:hypothetical protein
MFFRSMSPFRADNILSPFSYIQRFHLITVFEAGSMSTSNLALFRLTIPCPSRMLACGIAHAVKVSASGDVIFPPATWIYFHALFSKAERLCSLLCLPEKVKLLLTWYSRYRCLTHPFVLQESPWLGVPKGDVYFQVSDVLIDDAHSFKIQHRVRLRWGSFLGWYVSVLAAYHNSCARLQTGALA